MNARLTMFLRTLAIGCCVVAFTAVAQTDAQQRGDQHNDSGQQRPADQHAGHTGQQPQNRQQPGQQSRPEPQQSGQQQYQQQQQTGQQQHGQQTGQQYHAQPQQSGQEYQQHGQQSGQQYQQHGQQSGQQYQQHGEQSGQQYQQHGDQQQYQQHGDQQHGQQRGDQQYSHDANRGQQQYRAGNRPQQWGHAPANRPSFNFRGNDRDSLRRYYSSRLGGIDRAHRPVFRMGGYLPYEDLGFMSPVPPGVWGSLPPIPYGYEAGYWDGYVVVYDPNTGYILYVSDLM